MCRAFLSKTETGVTLIKNKKARPQILRLHNAAENSRSTEAFEMCKPIYDASEYRGLHGRKFKRKFTTIQTYPSALKHLTKIKEDANAAEINKLGRDQQADLIKKYMD